MRRCRFFVEALVEYEDAVEYYERAQTGLGDTFVREVDRVLALVLEFPEMAPAVPDTPAELNIRRCLIRRFGVEVDYQVVEEDLIVIAVFHGKREPGYWRARLERLRG